MKTYHKNPRTISDGDLADLRRWLEELVVLAILRRYVAAFSMRRARTSAFLWHLRHKVLRLSNVFASLGFLNNRTALIW